MGILLAILTGIGLGYIIERGDFCFHSVLRGLVSRLRQVDLFRAYLLAMLVAIPIVQGLIALGWIDPWVPPFAWQANLVGGTLFGIGMVMAATCITGLFYKLGHGMLGTLVGLVTWAVGDIMTYRGPLLSLRNLLNGAQLAAGSEAATVLNLGGWVGGVLLLLVGVATAVYLYRSPRQPRENYWAWLPLGLALGLFTSLAWLLAREGGANYTFGTSGVPSGALAALLGESGSGGSLWIPVTLVALVPGAFIAAYSARTLWVRGETMRRYFELAAGGFLMGVGAAISGGCNLGHSLVGVPLLSLGSITTTVAMFLGVFTADRLVRVLRARPAEPQWAKSV